jgi:hypothetical protein
LMSTFATSQTLPAHEDTKRLLRAICANSGMLSQAPEHWFVEKLEDLVTFCPDLVCTICDKLLDAVADRLKVSGTFAALSGSNLVNIAMTLQRMYAFRERGLELFERLVDLGVYDAATLLQNLDRRPINVPKPRPRRRRSRPRNTIK